MSRKLKKKKKLKKRKDLLVNRIIKFHFSFLKKTFIQNYFNIIDSDSDETESSDWELL